MVRTAVERNQFLERLESTLGAASSGGERKGEPCFQLQMIFFLHHCPSERPELPRSFYSESLQIC